MDSHKNAPMTPIGRLRMVQAVLAGEPVSAVATRLEVDRTTVRKWVARYRAEGDKGLLDRSSRPHRSPTAIARGTAQRVIALRRRRRTMSSIAVTLRISAATVSRVLARAGLSRLADLDPPPPPCRYERAAAGELLHIDIKKLAGIRGVGHRITADRQQRARGIGYDVTYVAVDDHSRVAFAEIWPAERADCATGFLDHALAYYASLGLRIQGILTDNGKVFDSGPFVQLCQRHRLKRLHTRFYRPQTNGKAERFIQTALREWAYGRTYRRSRERTAYLPRWLHHYNWHRPHRSLGDLPPISRLRLTGGNVLKLHN
ncbi:MAG TPA: IS481 family transposase [Casimicrobiaceae bacterium]|nr:IS481 family transposase [Casimicrobiaceae bacterium]